MAEQALTKSDPRWGQKGRDRKAEAILATLTRHCRRDLTHGLWLDVGCGSGGVAATLAGNVAQIIGIDPEPWERWQAFRCEHPNLIFYTGFYSNLETLLGAGSVDVVVCNQVYEHVDDPAALLKSIHRVLKPTGVCYFAGPNLLWPIEPHVFWPFVHWLPRQLSIRLMTFFRAKRVHYLDAWSMHYWALKKMFRHAGFVASNAIYDRIHAQAQCTDSTIMRAVRWIPRSVISALTPVAPGFIFVLTKSSMNGVDD
ncbi:class I SAM-dependent methyltransferase [Rhodanobacter sp. Root561]|uniref:class I SAM-dependent methyltransferase n=1 Tax=Rhodanobacter sp. Root561 TaxID=1736560 RepID=UPI000A3FE9B2|nr:class I SAM-dependent methyltransferase [Rhodanobacter sp. Root561]